jgi:hypothetical protein
VESILGPHGTSVTTGLLYLPRVIVMMMENLVESRLAGETEVRGGNLPQRHFVHHKSHLPEPGSNSGRGSGKPATNRLSSGAASVYGHPQVSLFAETVSLCTTCNLSYMKCDVFHLK